MTSRVYHGYQQVLSQPRSALPILPSTQRPDFQLIFKRLLSKSACLRGSARTPLGPYSAPRPPAGKGWSFVLTTLLKNRSRASVSIPTTTTDTTDSPPKVETLLVGNSLLRDVHFDGPDDRSQIRVVNKSGATFKEIEEMIDEAAKTHMINEIVIVACTNETIGDATADDVSIYCVRQNQSQHRGRSAASSQRHGEPTQSDEIR